MGFDGVVVVVLDVVAVPFRASPLAAAGAGVIKSESRTELTAFTTPPSMSCEIIHFVNELF